MDALTYLALTAKAKLVFENPDTFLSFPATTPLNYSADKLNFGVFNSPDNAERLVYSEFARIVNSLPSRTIFEMGDKFLWDTYSDVLRTATLAHSQATAEDTAAYQQAVAFLNVTDSSGLSSASPQLLAYRQYRDAWFVAVQNYKTQQSTAAALTDTAAITQWNTIDEPRLRAQVEQARNDWETKGFKKQVENAQQVEQSYAARSPELIWQSWSALFDPDIDLITDPAQQPFAPTSFIPSDVFSQDWLTFKITGAEIMQLVANAPAELKAIFATEGSQPTVDALSFEYRAVSLARHWFKPEVFEARFWRLPEGSDPLSDGGDPPKGRWPAYVAAVVFMRNIQITMHADHPAPPQMIRALPALKYIAVQRPGSGPQVRLAPIAQTAHLSPQTMAPRLAQLHSSPPVSIMRTPPPSIPEHFMIATPIRPVTAVARPAPPIGIVRPISPVPAPHPAGTTTPATTPPSPAPASSELAPNPKKDISILAFICKRLPKTPNPDPNLDWDDKPTT